MFSECDLLTKPNFKFKHVNGEFTVEVLEVLEDKNELKVSITGISGYGWPETWNLAHTIQGFRDRTYIE